jgi:hypothetical protein
MLSIRELRAEDTESTESTESIESTESTESTEIRTLAVISTISSDGGASATGRGASIISRGLNTVSSGRFSRFSGVSRCSRGLRVVSDARLGFSGVLSWSRLISGDLLICCRFTDALLADTEFGARRLADSTFSLVLGILLPRSGVANSAAVSMVRGVDLDVDGVRMWYRERTAFGVVETCLLALVPA